MNEGKIINIAVILATVGSCLNRDLIPPSKKPANPEPGLAGLTPSHQLTAEANWLKEPTEEMEVFQPEGGIIDQLNQGINKFGLLWQAGPTPLSDLSPAEQTQLLFPLSAGENLSFPGQNFSPGEENEENQPLPLSVDWRSQDGANWLSPVKNQGQCSTCVAFAVNTAVEALLRIAKKDPYLFLDQSDAHLFFCSGGSCRNGSWPDAALSLYQEPGVPTETCSPYGLAFQGQNLDCEANLCAHPELGLVTIEDWSLLQGEEQIKKALINGPVIAIMKVSPSFFSYQDGAYTPLPGEEVVGLHVFVIIGYDDEKGVWLCRNSWGKEWGKEGDFEVVYGVCDIGYFAWLPINFSREPVYQLYFPATVKYRPPPPPIRFSEN